MTDDSITCLWNGPFPAETVGQGTINPGDRITVPRHQALDEHGKFTPHFLPLPTPASSSLASDSKAEKAVS